jgi:Lon-like protease
MESPPTPLAHRPRVLAAAIVVLLALNGGGLYETDYYAIGPGPSTDILSALTISGVETYPSEGKLLITTASVSLGPLNLWEYLYSMVSPNQEAIERSRLFPPGTSDEESDLQNAVDMEKSKIDAEVAAFIALGLDVSVLPGGRVLGLLPKGPSDGILEVRDRIVAVEGKTTATPEAVVTAIQALKPGATAHLRVVRGSEEIEVEIVTRERTVEGRTVAVVGANLGRAFRLPHDVEIDTQRIGGPSGGLVFALSIIDALTEDDLTGGKTIAVTGTIALRNDGDATIGPVGGIAEKVRSARATGADVFIVPQPNEAEARAAAGDAIEIIGVARLSQAVAALRSLSRDRTV